jgi:hypothetical protein
MSGPTYYGSGETTNLENQIGFDKHLQKIITGDSDDPSVVAKTGAAGSLYLRTNGLQYRKTDSGSSTNWELVNTGALKDLDTLKVYCSDEDASTWTTGNNATFLGAGTLAGVFTKQSTTTPIRGAFSYEYVASAAVSINDWIASEAITLPTEFQARTIAISSQYLYNGLTNDIELKIYDVTNSVELEPTSRCYVEAVSGVTTIVKAVFIPANCASIKFGFHVVAEPAASTVLRYDSNEISRNPFVYKDLSNQTDWVSLTYTQVNALTGNQGLGTFSAGSVEWKRDGSDLLYRGKLTCGTTTAAEIRIALPTSLTSAGTSLIPSIQQAGMLVRDAADPSSKYVLIEPSVGYFALGSQSSGWGGLVKIAAANIFIVTGEQISFNARIPIKGWSSVSEHVVTPASVKCESISYTGYTNKDGSNFVKFATKDTLRSNESKMLYLDNSTYTKYTMLQDGMFNAVATVPQAVAAQTSIELRHYNLSGTLIKSATFLITHAISSQAVLSGKALKGDYFLVMSTFNIDGTYPEYVNFSITAIPTEANFLAAVPVTKVAVITDTKTNGTNGGTFTAGAWQQRDLNSVTGNTEIVTVAANAFTLQSGKYKIYTSAPAWATNGHQCGIATGATPDIALGTSEHSAAADTTGTRSVACANVEITTATTYKILHYAKTSSATYGFGSAISVGSGEVYTIVIVEKLK